MTVKLELYKCPICGNVVQVMHEGEGELVCCGQVMSKLEIHNSDDEMQEKHVPVFLDENKVQVGSVPHPMIKEHYIEFIQAISPDKKIIETKFLSPDENPEAMISQDKNTAIEYCNIHGLWGGNK